MKWVYIILVGFFFLGCNPHSTPNSIEKLWSSDHFLEGPLWDDTNQRLIFSQVTQDKLLQWTEQDGVEILLEPSGNVGGSTFDLEGHLLLAQSGPRQIGRLNNNQVELITSRFEWKKFNSPNDLVVKSDGTIWFTDPNYGLIALYGEDKAAGYEEIGAAHVFRFDEATNSLTSIYDQLSKPNGLAFSPDESTLYVGNSAPGNRKIMAFDIASNNIASNPRVFTTIESHTWGVDGLKVDDNGNLYAATGLGVDIFNPKGHLKHRIETPFRVTNLAFGPDEKTLYLTSHKGLYRVPNPY